ncbi:MAG: hypothetical protein KDC54_14700, partial [Lewinella sp.]|nr:hypothetical protein [Lewinella sp.]
NTLAKSKLIDVFRTLAPEELRWLRDFVDSPYFNKHEVVRTLCRHLIQAHREGFPERLLEKSTLGATLFPEEADPTPRLHHTMSKLYQLTLQFLAQRQWEGQGQATALAALQALADRQLQLPFQQQLRQCQQQLDEPQQLHELWQCYRLHEIAEQHYAHQRDRQINTSFLQGAADQLDQYYVARRLALGCAMMTRQHALNEQYELHFSGLLPVPNPRAATAPLSQVYAQLFALLQRDNAEVQLTEYYRFVLAQASILGPEATQELIYYAINYCIQQIRKGHRQFTGQLLSIYEQGLAEGHLLEQGELSPWNYKNIVKLGLGLQRFEWVEAFIQRYTDQLPDAHRADAFHFNSADLHYHRQQYDQALDHLNQVEFSDLHYKLGARAMLLKIYYETEAEEAFLSLLQSFHLYLKRDQVASQDIRQAYLNFIRMAKKLHRCPPDRARSVSEEIRQTASLNDRTWLLRQLAVKMALASQ